MGESRLRTLFVQAQTETPFVILALNAFTDTDPKGLPDPGPDRPWLTFSLPRGLSIPGKVPFSFPDRILTEASLGTRKVVLTRHGGVVTSPDDGQSYAVFPVNFGNTSGAALGSSRTRTWAWLWFMEQTILLDMDLRG
ncbi:MAG: hypothetical protein ACE15E_22920 [Acidobacteriota bacterium]